MSLAPPSGRDSLRLRRAYFRERRSYRLRDHRLGAGWVILAAVLSWLFIVGFTGFAH
jgi:hypothetical protein